MRKISLIDPLKALLTLGFEVEEGDGNVDRLFDFTGL
jgi:hypothetical protein